MKPEVIYEDWSFLNCMFHPQCVTDRVRMEKPTLVNIFCNSNYEVGSYDFRYELHVHHLHNEMFCHATGENLFERRGDVKTPILYGNDIFFSPFVFFTFVLKYSLFTSLNRQRNSCEFLVLTPANMNIGSDL